MPHDDHEVLTALLKGQTYPFAVLNADGSLALASRAFLECAGLGPETPAPDWLTPGVEDGRQIRVGERHFEIWTASLDGGRVVGLRERTELARLEDQIWEHQTRLSKVYSELSVRNQALTTTLEKLREREAELNRINQGLEEKVKEQLQLLERSNRLMRYLSPDVANSIVKGETPDLAPRKRQLTIFFADLSSFDELVAEMESEEVIEILNDYRREMTSVIFANGGTLDKFISARIMGFFGDPVAHEDHAARAVRAGLQMRTKVQTLRKKWFPSSTHVDIQAGIHTGYATVGNVGSEHRVDYTVIGKNVALAGALQQEAGPGQILLTSRTYEAVKELFEVESVQVQLKGSSRPVAAFNAKEEKTALVSVPPGVVSGLLRALAEPGEAAGKEKKLGPYVVLDKVGQGGMGIVYKARDERLQRTVAVKVIFPELAADVRLLERFRREAQALASLNSPHIAQIYFISDQEFPPFFAMEFVEGPTLRRVLTEQGRLPLRRALDLACQIARGLQAAAEKGIIHRDVKPENVMLTPKGQVKLTDFGLVKSVDQEPGLTTKGLVVGTPFYMSPEQARGEEIDLRSDIYSLGATFFHMVVGHPPFRAESAMAVLRKHEEEPLPPMNTLPSSVSTDVYQILQRMMAKKREDRFENYDRLLEMLENC
ncbi:MAG: protein kinase [Planctomycetes bacterium]|nr:protein kinase [Planctomycetota bacterium]